MHRPAVHVERVEVERMLGIASRHGWELADLSPTFNLIRGPNGCGKTTTARAIQELLWPGETGLTRPTLRGTLRQGDATCRVDLHAGTCNREGDTPPPTGPAEHRWRYWLALDDLLQKEDREFARTIAVLSQGRHDLAAAADKLGFRDTHPRITRQRDAVTSAAATLRAARRRDQDLQGDADRLADLAAQRDRATAAAREVVHLETALAYSRAEAKRAQTQAALDALPLQVGRLDGKERDTLDRLAQQEQTKRTHLHEAHARRERALEAARAAGLPEGGIDPAALGRWRQLADRAKAYEVERDRHHRELREAQAAVEQAGKRLGTATDVSKLATLDAIEPEGVAELARASQRLAARHAVNQERQRRLGDAEPTAEGEVDDETLARAHAFLSQWLATPPPPVPVAPDPAAHRATWSLLLSALLGALLATVLGVVLAVVHHWAWAICVVAAVAVAGWGVWAWWSHRRREAQPVPVVDEREPHRRSFESTGVPRPPTWTAEAAGRRLHDLTRSLAQRRDEQERRRRLAELEQEAADHARQRAVLDEELAGMYERWGVRPTVGEAWLSAFAEQLASWQTGCDRAAAARAARDAAAGQVTQVLKRLAQAMEPLGLDHTVPEDAAGAVSQVEDLDRRHRAHAEAKRDADDAEAHIKRLEEELAQVAHQRREMLAPLGLLGLDDEPIEDAHMRLNAWLEQRERFYRVQREVSDHRVLRDNELQKLRQADRAALAQADELDLSDRLSQQRALAEGRESLAKEIITIEERIRVAKLGHNVDEARAKQDAALAALADELKQEQAARTGAVLAEWLRGRVEREAQPAVQRRAAATLSRITRGTMELTIERSDGGERLGARVRGEPRPLDRLSSGERAQVLLAVRLAFMEENEAARLPLIVDEGLGNSDDERAPLIIQTILDCAREGRQVFCLTSQGDEAVRWLRGAREAGVEVKDIDLAAHRVRAAAAALPLNDPPASSPPSVASPGEGDRYAYAKLLGDVPAVDPRDESGHDLHLWHVVHDPRVLHRLLALRVRTWGQLEAMLGRDGEVDVAELDAQRVRAAACAVRAASEAWRIGRGTPVDRDALLDSGCVSDTFLDDVTALAAQVEGDAGAFIAALGETGRIPRWRQNKTDELREYLLEAGYLSPHPRLTPDALRLRVLGSIGDDLAAGRLDPAWLDELIATLAPTD